MKAAAALAALLLLAAASHAAPPAESARVGTVDLSIVRALHPLNLVRDPETGLRLRPVAPGTPEEIGAACRARDAEQERAVAACEAETARIRERQSLLRRLIRDIEAEVEAGKRDLKGRYALEYAKGASREREETLQAIRRDLRRIDEQIGYRAATVELEIRSGEERIRTLRERAFAINFLSAKEAAACEARIARDCVEAVRRVAASRRLLAVLNRAATLPAPAPAAEDPVEAHWRTGNAGFPLLFHAARDDAEFASGVPDEAALSDYRFRLAELLERSGAGGAPGSEEFVPAGGADVTAATLEELLKAFGHRKERIRATVEAAEAFLAAKGAR